MKEVVIYTDGACSGNPGPGGWGAVLLAGPYRKELSGYEAMFLMYEGHTSINTPKEAEAGVPFTLHFYASSCIIIDNIHNPYYAGSYPPH
jgi:ribonuclease HI